MHMSVCELRYSYDAASTVQGEKIRVRNSGCGPPDLNV
jgi:hypothetical protein